MSAGLIFRRPSDADLPAIQRMFAREAWKTSGPLLSDLLALPGAVPLSAYRDGELVGFCLGVVYGKVCWTGYLIVADSNRASGIGSALKARLINALGEAGVKTFRNISRAGLAAFQGRHAFSIERKVLYLSKQHVRTGEPSPGTTPNLAALARYDSKRFMGDRSHRLATHLHMARPCFVLAGRSGQDIRGYALAWKNEAGSRIGPVVHEAGVELAEIVTPLLQCLPEDQSLVSICVYSDDSASCSALGRMGFKHAGEALQFVSGDIENRQDPRIKSVWGRASG